MWGYKWSHIRGKAGWQARYTRWDTFFFGFALVHSSLCQDCSHGISMLQMKMGSRLYVILEASPNLSSSSLNWPVTFSNLHWLEKWGVRDEKRHIPKKGRNEQVLMRKFSSMLQRLLLATSTSSGFRTGDLESLLCCKSSADILLNGAEIEILVASSNQPE